jgi:hypothetical protein
MVFRGEQLLEYEMANMQTNRKEIRMVEYRELGQHEVIDKCKGDQYLSLAGNWHDSAYTAIDGRTPFKEASNTASRVKYRRPVDADVIGKPQHVKDSNPKDAVGSTKPPVSNVPLSVISEVGMALAEGQYKYGGYNWRVIGVRASVYWNAAFRHIKAWWEGEDTDPDSQLSHITKAISALVVLRDAMIQENWNDDRPPRSKQTPTMVSEQYKQMLERLKSLQPDPVEGYTQKGIDDGKQ